MSKQRSRKQPGRPPTVAAAFAAHNSELGQRAQEFIAWLRVKSFAASTAKMRRQSLHHFLCWCDERAISTTAELTGQLLEHYAKHLLQSKDSTGKLFTANNRAGRLTAVAKFCWWLGQQDFLPDNPAAKLVYPQVPKNLPKNVLNHQQIEEILQQPAVTTPVGIRDRAIMEFLYSTGIRRAEASSLTLADVDLDNGLVYVRHGKGNKPRVGPVGTRALQWLKKYLLEVRPNWIREPAPLALFVTCQGTPITSASLGVLVARYIKTCHYGGSCHVFRHAMATEMLNHGADLRHIQEILGHESIATTQIYTHLSLEKLQQVYRQTHPANNYTEPEIVAVNPTVRKHQQAYHPKPLPPQPRPENELSQWVQAYLTSLRLANYSEGSITSYQAALKQWVRWCQAQGLTQAQQLSQRVLEQYHHQLSCRAVPGKMLAAKTISHRLSAAIVFCQFLAERRVLPADITQKLQRPKYQRSIPGQVLSEQEVTRILAQPDVSTALGLRDRAVLELLYATGIRWQELQCLATSDINIQAATVFVRRGKGGQQRLVPATVNALAWVEQYLQWVRPLLVQDEGQPTLFLSNSGRPLDLDAVSRRLKQYAQAAGVTKPVSCHKFRHAMATALLDHGADIRTVQEILGHRSLSSTQIYTKVAIRKLKEVHEQTHPARSKPKRDRQDNAGTTA